MSVARHLILALLFIVLISLYSLGISTQAGYFPAALLVLGAGIWLVAQIFKSREFIWNSVGSALAVVVGLIAAGFWRAPLQDYKSLDTAIFGLFSLIIFVFLLNLFTERRQIRDWEKALLIFALLAAGVELFAAVKWFQQWRQVVGVPNLFPTIGYRSDGGVFGHPNILSGFLNLIIPIVLLRILTTKKKTPKTGYAIILLVLLLTQYFTSSRAGWASGAAGLAVAAGLLYLPDLGNKKTIEQIKQKLSFWHVAGLLSGIVLMILAGAFLFRQASITPGHGGRLDIWSAAWQVFEMDPLFGNGTGTFQLFYAGVIQAPPGFVAEHAHNIFLQVGAEYGLVGVAALTILLVQVVAGWLRAWKAVDAEARASLAAYGGIWTAIILHQTLDYLFENILYAFTVLALIVFTSFNDRESTSKKVSGKKLAVPLLVVLLLFMGGVLLAVVNSDSYYQGTGEGRLGRWSSAGSHICLDADAAPRRSFFQFQCALAISRIAFEEDDQELLSPALGYLQNGLEKDPYWPVHWANLAMIQWQLGEREQALESMQKASEAAPTNALFALNLGWMAESMGNSVSALEFYTLALENDPWLSETVFFLNGTELRKEILTYKNFAQLLNRSDQYTIKAHRQIFSGDWGEAEENLGMALQENPLNGVAHALLGNILELQGKSPDAWIEVQTALLLSQKPIVLYYASETAFLQGREEAGLNYLELAFKNWAFVNRFSLRYYQGTYHRDALPFDLVAGFQLVELTPQMREGFLRLHELYLEQGRLQDAEEIIRWIEISG